MRLLITLLTLFTPALLHAAPTGTTATAAVSESEPINKLCPIGVEPLDGETYATYDGHTIGFCCAGCDTKFLAWSKQKKDAFVLKAVAGQEGTPTEAAAEKAEVPSEPYTLSTCPVSGEKLGSMGDPLKLIVEGREVLLCCKGCVRKMQTDPAKYRAVVDAGLIAQQKPYYPVTTCIVTGEPLVEDGKDIALDVVVNNRLFRLCCKSCVKKVKADPAEHFAVLDAKVKETQRHEYPLDTCIVREKSKLGAMGGPKELVVGNRLVRFCCEACMPKFAEGPRPFLARLDAAWAPVHARRAKEAPGKGAGHDGHDHGEHGGD